MKSRWMKVLIGMVAAVALGSMAIGLASPDGSVGGTIAPVNQGPRPTPTTSPASTPAPAEEQDEPAAVDLAPASVAGTWPGLPADVDVIGDQVEWCGAVNTTGDAEAVRQFGREEVDAAACAAVSFIFEHRYSRLSLPRKEYTDTDFASVLPALDPATISAIYRPRIASFIADPGSNKAGEQLGLVLFTARDTQRGADHASAGHGHTFYGPAFSSRGYQGRAAWINPTWSTVTIRVDHSSSRPRIEAELSASASIPVRESATGADAMLTVPTRARFTVRLSDDSTWLINGWTISRGTSTYAPLSVR